jgi:hypothetical protein
LSSHLHQCFSSSLFPSGIPTQILYELLTSTMGATCLAYLILLDYITRSD